MSIICNTLDGYDNPSCASNVTVGGVTGRIIIMTAKVFSGALVTQDADGVITDITLSVVGGSQAGDQGFLFDLPRNSPKPSSPGTKGADGGGYTHTVPFLIPKLDQKTKNWVASLINRNLCVALVENLDGKFTSGAADDRAYWELYGIQSGLEASVSDSQRAAQDTGNGIMVTLTTPTDATLEYTMPLNINDGVSRASTDLIVEALLVPAV